MKNARRKFVAILLLLLPLAVLGCGNSESETPPAADLPEEPPLRVVSLAPALTQMIVDMGQEKTLVGVGENDAASPKGLPIVGNFVDVNTEALLRVKPTHVVMMIGKEGAPPRLTELATQNNFQLVLYPYPQKIEDVANILYAEEAIGAKGVEPPSVWSLGVVLQDAPAARRVKYTMLPQLANIAKLTLKAPHPRVLMVIGTSPVMASGSGTVLNELLHMAGGENAADDMKVPAPTYTRETLIQAAPDVVLLIMPDAPALEAIDADPRLAEFRGLAIPAVRNGKIILVNDTTALMPSSTLPRVAAAIAKAVHPELADAIDVAMKAPTLPPTTRPSEESHEKDEPSATAPAK